jgi:hypothetical protein
MSFGGHASAIGERPAVRADTVCRRSVKTDYNYFPPGLCHAVEFKQGPTLLSIEVEGERAATVEELFAAIAPGTLIPGNELFPLSLRIRDELRNKRQSSDVVLESP